MRFLYNVPALLYRNALIVGDTHFGIEQRLQQKGIRAAHLSAQLAEKLVHTAREHAAKKIIFLGDIKDEILRVDPITRTIFAQLKKEFELVIVRGNHDGGVEELGVEVAPSSGLLFGELALVHGHAWPDEPLMRARYLVSAHQHPQLALPDAFGKRHEEPVWVIAQAAPAALKKVYARFNRKIQLLVLPAFNPLVGFPIRKLTPEHLGPLLNNNLFKWDDALAYRLDGNVLGKIKNL